jgi:protein SCO1
MRLRLIYSGIPLIALAILAQRASADEAPARVIPEQYQNVGVTEYPNVQLPLDLNFLDEHDQIVPLRSFFQTGRPVVLQLGYYGCPKLCDVISHALVQTARQIDSLTVGKDFQFVFLSINPAETADLAGMKKQSLLEAYNRPGAENGFHCLVGQDMNIQKLAAAIGFRYHRVDIDGEFAHPAVLFVLTPEGHMSRYLYGVAVPADTLKFSLVEAGQGKIGSSWDKLALLICCYDVETGKYTLAAVRLMRFAGVVTMLTIGGGMFWLSRRGGKAIGTK